MKSQIALSAGQPASTPVLEQRGRDSAADEPTWVIEEPMPPGQMLHLSGPDPRVIVVCGLAALVIGLGLVGHWLDHFGLEPPSAVPVEATPAADLSLARSAALTVVSPSNGDEVIGAVVDVRGVASGPLGTIHVAIRLGDAVLGWKNMNVDRAGPIATAIDVFAPPFDVPVELLVNRQDAPESTVSRSFHLRASGLVQVWGLTLTRSGGERWLTLQGTAPLTIPQLLIRIYTDEGELFGDTAVPNGPNDELAGAVGGHLLGLGCFRASFDVGDTRLGDSARLEVSWPDPFGGPLSLSESIIVAVPGLPASSR